MKILKIREVKTPIRAHKTDAGIDFFVPVFTDNFIDRFNELNRNVFIDYEKGYFSIRENCDILIPSGIKVKPPKNHALIAFNKSGVATKKKLFVGASVVDENYQGEVHLHLINSSKKTINVYENEKIVQFILIPVLYSNIEVVNNVENLYSDISARGEGGFGSTN